MKKIKARVSYGAAGFGSIQIPGYFCVSLHIPRTRVLVP